MYSVYLDGSIVLGYNNEVFQATHYSKALYSKGDPNCPAYTKYFLIKESEVR